MWLKVCVQHYPCLTWSVTQQRSKVVDQMACQANCCPVISSSKWQSGHHWICQHKITIHSLTSFCLAVLSCNLWEHFSCAMPCCIRHSGLFTPFPLAAFLPFIVHITDLPCIAVSWLLWRFGARKRVFVQESNALTQTAHNVDYLPGTEKEIFLSQLLLWKSQSMLCMRKAHRSFRAQGTWSCFKLCKQCNL